MPAEAGVWTYLVPVLILGVALARNLRARKLRVERMWISPAIVMTLTAWVFSQGPPPGLVGLVLDLVALAFGALLGWWRARASRFTIDPTTHVITSKVSPAGLFLILGIFSVRFLVRGLLADEASVLHVTAAEITDSFLLMAVGLVSAQRVEWLIRARRMIAEAKRS